MLLIDRLVSREDNQAVGTAFLEKDTPFLSTNGEILPEYFLEIIAQTMAAARGYDATRKNEPKNLGFIAGVESFMIHPAEKTYTSFTIATETILITGPLHLIRGEVLCENTCIAEATVKVWIEDATRGR